MSTDNFTDSYTRDVDAAEASGALSPEDADALLEVRYLRREAQKVRRSLSRTARKWDWARGNRVYAETEARVAALLPKLAKMIKDAQGAKR